MREGVNINFPVPNDTLGHRAADILEVRRQVMGKSLPGKLETNIWVEQYDYIPEVVKGVPA